MNNQQQNNSTLNPSNTVVLPRINNTIEETLTEMTIYQRFIKKQLTKITICKKLNNIDISFCPKLESQEDDGVIVLKNEITQKLIELILLEDEQLKQKMKGITTAGYHRFQLVNALHQLWD